MAERMDYRVVYADPPWQYRDKAAAGNRGACFKYGVMDLNSIRCLPVWTLVPYPNVAPSFLFLWVTMPMLAEGLEVMKAWGFTFKTVAFVWVKTTGKGKMAWGMGNWTRSNAELVLMGIRGKGHKRRSAGVHQVVMTERQGHSVKPLEAGRRIVELVGNLPRIDLFARTRQPGWHVWGDEVESDVVLTDGRFVARKGVQAEGWEGAGPGLGQLPGVDGPGLEGGRQLPGGEGGS